MPTPRSPRYVVVPASDVAPEIVAMASDMLLLAFPELDLGTVPEIRWFADTRELTARQVAASPEVFTPGDGIPKAGSVPPFVSYTVGGGWQPTPPVIMLNRTQCRPDTPLHELRHLWQIKAGRYRADEESTPELEDDADAWAAAMLSRLEL